ncbi:restriction endonuclease subunit S [Trichloromonas acetexigens]|uniref:Restriction endonuclease subunit S n=1 Tax=Trichloromonas acetexigens TaxID=38815 RepID=A0A550JFC2_9BACT|nr:restriction endonuclease subunit S [Desulfuromonas acetexigens]TRO81924.1 restriction endonuclease subunit S [Desulfuromonas acetexigens]
MMSWKEDSLGDVCELINRGVAPKYIEEGGVAVLNQKCIRDHSINPSLARRHDSAAKKVNPDRYIKVGDVLVNSTGTGTLGRVAQVRQEPNEPTTVDTHVTIVRPQPGKFFNDFFGYMMIKIEEEIATSGEGASGQTELARSVLAEKFRVSYPDSLPEQKRIVDILDEAFAGIDAAIANTEKNHANARELFESYLNAVFTQKGDGWVEKTLGEVYDVRDGTHDSPKYHSEGFPLVTSKNLKRDGLNLEKVQYISESDYLKINERSAVSVGDVLLAMIGTIGNPTVVEVEPSFSIKNVALFKVPQGQNSHFLKYYLQSGFVVSKMKKEAKGTTQKFVGLGYLRSFPIFVPSLSDQNKIVSRLDDICTESNNLESLYKKKLTALAELKQSILQKAFAGELTTLLENAIDEAVA